jgi:hypothetical protein
VQRNNNQGVYSMAITTLKEMRTRVNDREVFKGNSVYSEHTGANLYCVYSYGSHFPMYVYDYVIEKWIGNTSKYGVTTSKHQSKCHPNNVSFWLDTDGMKELIQLGGFVQYKTAREV